MSNYEQRMLLMITDDAAQCRSIAAIAAREGWRTTSVRDAKSAFMTLDTPGAKELGAIIIERRVFGDQTGALISELRAHRPGVPIVMLTASASPLLAAQAMRAGASDYLIKPVAPAALVYSLRAAARYKAQHEELAPLAEKLSSSPDFEGMIGAAPTFRAALAVAAKAARGHGPVLIEGESGTGKEMLARAIHGASVRAKAPLHIVDIAATPVNSIESVLFGYEKNAFPGAFARHAGELQQCDGGTLMIDGIDALPHPIQGRLLEATRTGSVRPIGAQHSFSADVRLIAASNLRLRDIVGQGHFLAGLLEALAPVTVMLPPLRERTGDIPALARHFLARIAEQSGMRELGITDGALMLLSASDWPGNVRQLQAVLFRATVFCDRDALTPADFPHLSNVLRGSASIAHAGTTKESSGVMLYADDGNLRPLEEIELDIIRLAVGVYRGRMAEVARRLGIGRSTLYRKLSQLGIEDNPGRTFAPLSGLVSSDHRRQAN